MNIVMFTNTYAPHVGGVARSVESFARQYRLRGHRVLVVAPEFEGQPKHEIDVVRIPAIQHFNGSDFSVVLPIPGLLTDTLDEFRADVVHSHHPFLLGNTAARVARFRDLPLVFTHHTLYEQYTHYVPADSAMLKRFVVQLATCYANLCDLVFAPSESVAALLCERGVKVPVTVLPTGVDFDRFSSGNGAGFRAALGVPADVFLVGHVGRLAPEKNLEFLTEAVAGFLAAEPLAWFLLVGQGPCEARMVEILDQHNLIARLYRTGVLDHDRLPDAYAAMDVFAFTSRSETQGMVLTEAMAAGTPVVALDATGVREVVRDGDNGRLLHAEDVEAFCAALAWVYGRSEAERARMRQACRETGRAFSIGRCAETALSLYGQIRAGSARQRQGDEGVWAHIADLIRTEWDLLSGGARALGAAIGENGRKHDVAP